MKEGFKGYGGGLDALRGRKAGAKSLDKPPHARKSDGFKGQGSSLGKAMQWPGQSNSLPKK